MRIGRTELARRAALADRMVRTIRAVTLELRAARESALAGRRPFPTASAPR
jgi:hypothetical protein